MRIRRGRPCVSAAMIDKSNCCFCFASAIVVAVLSLLPALFPAAKKGRTTKEKGEEPNGIINAFCCICFMALSLLPEGKCFFCPPTANQPQPPCSPYPHPPFPTVSYRCRPSLTFCHRVLTLCIAKSGPSNSEPTKLYVFRLCEK